MEWKNRVIDLGIVKQTNKVIIEFEATSIISNVGKVSTSCGCTKAVIKDSKVVVTYKPGSIPIHLKEMTTFKNIIIYYKDGSQDILTFNAKVIK